MEYQGIANYLTQTVLKRQIDDIRDGLLKVRVGIPQTCLSPPVILLLAVPRRLLCFGSSVILDV
ncbi:MAG: hypothetical protein AB2764_09345, partial [Candidatus Thiodiazotropha endolucinida]